jgi:hypothetical protein
MDIKKEDHFTGTLPDDPLDHGHPAGVSFWLALFGKKK